MKRYIVTFLLISSMLFSTSYYTNFIIHHNKVKPVNKFSNYENREFIVFYDNQILDVIDQNPGSEVIKVYDNINAAIIRSPHLMFDPNVYRQFDPDVFNKEFFLDKFTEKSYDNLVLEDNAILDDQFSFMNTFPFEIDTSNMVVGIIDNGVDLIDSLNHIDLVEEEFHFQNRGSGEHGTIVAQALSGRLNSHRMGLADNVTLVSARMGSPSEGTIGGDFLGAWNYLFSYPNMSVINTSWGDNREYDTSIWNEFMNIANQNNVAIVGSAGNNRIEGSKSNRQIITGPGSHKDAFSIGSVDINNSPSFFSSEGPNSEGIVKPDFVELGEEVVFLSTQGNLQTYSGTSFSSPFFAGSLIAFISYLQSYNITYTTEGIKALFFSNQEINKSLIYRIGAGKINYTKIINNLIPDSHLSTIASQIDIYKDLNLPYNAIKAFNSSLYFGNISSEFTISLSGNISSIVTVKIIDKSINHFINTSQALTNHNYTGYVKINTSNYDHIIFIGLRIIDVEYRYHSFLMMGYTSFDHIRHERVNSQGSSRVGGMKQGLFGERNSFFLKSMSESGIIVEEYHLPVSSINISDFNYVGHILGSILFLDAFSKNLHEYPNNFLLTDSEVLLIKGFVDNGINIIFTTYGDLEELDSNIEINDEGIKLLDIFDIASGTKVAESDIFLKIKGWELDFINSSSLFSSNYNYRHRGSYFTTDNQVSNFPHFQYSSANYGAISHISKGTFLVSSPIWTTNCGIDSGDTDCINSQFSIPSSIDNINQYINHTFEPKTILFDNITLLYENDTTHLYVRFSDIFDNLTDSKFFINSEDLTPPNSSNEIFFFVNSSVILTLTLTYKNDFYLTQQYIYDLDSPYIFHDFVNGSEYQRYSTVFFEVRDLSKWTLSVSSNNPGFDISLTNEGFQMYFYMTGDFDIIFNITDQFMNFVILHIVFSVVESNGNDSSTDSSNNNSDVSSLNSNFSEISVDRLSFFHELITMSMTIAIFINLRSKSVLKHRIERVES